MPAPYWYPTLLALLLLPACTVGPDFEKPALPKEAAYTSGQLSLKASSSSTAGGSQTLVSGQDIPAQWWTLFHSKPLNALVEKALKNNPDLKAAQAALKVAQENTLAQYGGYYPSVTATMSASRQKTSAQFQPNPNSGALIYNLYTPQVSVSYAPDVFGLNARSVESLKAQEGQARFALTAAHVALTANVINAAIQEASLREQIAATREIITLNNDMLGRLRNQFARGLQSRLDVAAQEAQLAQVSATLPTLEGQLAQQHDLLMALTGSFPTGSSPGTVELSGLTLPEQLPLTLPSRLMEQRPDIRQAEENLHAASAQIGIAVANRLPNISITGDIGSMALAAGQLFTHGTGVWTLAGGITQPVFDGGTLMHKERAARAAFILATEQYHSTVLTAFQNVADCLYALQKDARALDDAHKAQGAAVVTLDLTKRQLQSGSANYLAMLNAEQTYQQARINLIQAQANRFADTAALFQALGGGWWNN